MGVKTLRVLINEVMSPKVRDHLQRLVRGAEDNADKFVSSLVSGDRDSGAADELAKTLETLRSLESWMEKNEEPQTKSLKKFNDELAVIVDKSGFWQTPSFLGRTKHVETMQAQLTKLQHAYMALEASFGRGSGVRPKHGTSVAPNYRKQANPYIKP